MSEDKFEVKLDESTNILYAHVEVFKKPTHLGISFYDFSIVMSKLKNLGYDVSEGNCISRSRPVRSDSDDRRGPPGEKYSKATWKFQLTPNIEEETVLKPPPAKKASKKASKKTSKKTSRQTTKSVLKSYNKKR